MVVFVDWCFVVFVDWCCVVFIDWCCVVLVAGESVVFVNLSIEVTVDLLIGTCEEPVVVFKGELLAKGDVKITFCVLVELWKEMFVDCFGVVNTVVDGTGDKLVSCSCGVLLNTFVEVTGNVLVEWYVGVLVE
jgi:hypothetical protein